MQTSQYVIPIFLFIVVATVQTVAMLLMGQLFGPSRDTSVKASPYESGMDPIHDTRRRFDIRFHLVAIAFLVFDVEVLFMYPWAVAAQRAPEGEPARGLDAAVASGFIADRGLVFGVVMFFIALFFVGYLYALKKGVFRWR
jgi:NADH-quinone oxidoreductase subunit A